MSFTPFWLCWIAMCILFGVSRAQRVRHLLPFSKQYRPQLAWSLVEFLLAWGGAAIGVGQLGTGNWLVPGLAEGPALLVVAATLAVALAALRLARSISRARLAQRTARRGYSFFPPGP